MIDLKNINNNIIANRWKQKYAEQPIDIKEKLDKLDDARVEEYQLQVIKRKRIYPQVGDIFEVNPKNDIILHGVVINNHINNINGEDLLLILIFRENEDIKKIIYNGVKNEHLLIPPQIVGKEYWTRGYFYNVDYIENINKLDNYGFYIIGEGKFCDEYGNNLIYEPQLPGIYGVATISGIARKINQELIIAGII